MKKILSILLCIILMFSFCGCNRNLEPDTSHNYVDEYRIEFYDNMKKNEIVSNGVAKYCILLPNNASQILIYAANDFNSLLEQSSGVQLPIIYEVNALPDDMTGYISLGETEAYKSESFNLDYSKLNNDGFYVRVKGLNYYIIGNNERGVLYGCYDLLKRYVGVRFISMDCTHYESLSTVSFAEYDYSCAPDFEQRSFLDINMVMSQEYGIRITQYGEFGSGTLLDTPWASDLGNIHTIMNYVDYNKYRSEHPEFFSSYTNPNADPNLNSNHFDDVCYSNGVTDDGKLDETKDISVAKIVLNKIKDYLKANPTKSFFMIGISDQYNAYCMCDKCEEREKLFGEKSGIMTMFSNVIANEINEWVDSEEGQSLGIDHDINIIQFAYYWTLNPPVHEENGVWVANHNLAIPNEYVYIRYAPLNANYEFSLGAEQQYASYKKVVEGWSAISDNLMVYDYCLRLGWRTMYMPHLSNLSEQAKYLKDNDFCYWMYESDFSTDGLWNIDLIRYIVTNLWWDVNADVNALKDEFVDIYNGKTAAPYIKEFIKIMEENNARLKTVNGITANVFGTSDITVENYPRALLEQAISLIDEAKNAINNDATLTTNEKNTYLKRLAEVRIIPESIMLFNYEKYYVNGTDMKKAFAQDFYKNTQFIELKSIASGMTVLDYLNTL
ncbi:MAG: DUF4838 domain-containing protein [Alphaproteobacteria bacterium]|nr:DUF4838 domain-containing protein [Alphaproteobacteria bacterium]